MDLRKLENLITAGEKKQQKYNKNKHAKGATLISLTKAISTKLNNRGFNIEYRQLSIILETIWEYMQNAIMRGDKVSLYGMGILHRVVLKPERRYVPSRKEFIQLGERYGLMFRHKPEFLKRMNLVKPPNANLLEKTTKNRVRGGKFVQKDTLEDENMEFISRYAGNDITATQYINPDVVIF
jgi:nucleoid DNA-binding protein